MRMWTGNGVMQWENSRMWNLNGASEFCRADGALLVPGGFTSLSVFFRRVSQTAGTFELRLWTAPIYFKLLDDDVNVNNAGATLLNLAVEPTAGLQITGTGPQVFGARIAPAQAMGSMLFWEMKNTVAAGVLVGDLYVVPNHAGSATVSRLGRTVDGASNEAPALVSLRDR